MLEEKSLNLNVKHGPNTAFHQHQTEKYDVFLLKSILVKPQNTQSQILVHDSENKMYAVKTNMTYPRLT